MFQGFNSMVAPVLFLVLVIGSALNSAEPKEYPNNAWTTTNPATLGMDAVTLYLGSDRHDVLRPFMNSLVLAVKGHDRNDTRFKGGFGIYDAPEPWGPWTTVYLTKQWDMGPGETSSLPTVWMSQNGTTCWLVFSGDDSFSLRQVRFSTP